MDRKFIFIGGIHGVGKTSICKNISEKLGIPYWSASELIRRRKKISYRKNKHTVNIEGNQDILTEAITSCLPRNATGLLDGHFCLLDRAGKISNIPIETFELIAPKAILVLTDEPEEIASRIFERDGRSMDPELIREFQAKEVDYSLEVAIKIRAAYLQVSLAEKDVHLAGFIRKYLNY